MHREFIKALCDLINGTDASIPFLESAINGYVAIFGGDDTPSIRFGNARFEAEPAQGKAVFEAVEVKEYLGVEMGLMGAPKRPSLGGFVGVVGLGKQGKGYKGETPLVQFDWQFEKWMNPDAEAAKINWKKEWLSNWEKDGARLCGHFGGSGVDGGEGVPLMVDTSNLLSEIWFEDPKQLSMMLDASAKKR